MKNIEFKYINWRSIFFLCILPFIGIYLAYNYIVEFGFSWPIFALTVFYYYASGLSITGGYHRLFSHRTYEASLVTKLLYLFFGAGAFQDSVLTWCTDHRYHHKYTDTEKDPYNAQRGFWFSHMGWMLSLRTPVEERMAKSLTRDLRNDPWVMLQHNHYVKIAIFSGFIVPALIGWLWGAPMGAFIFAGLLRVVFVHQYTFFINSLAHIWGKQTFGTDNSAKDNAFISLFTYGEGYHNFHHHFQNDYRNGIRWYDYDPTKWIIRFMNYLGMTEKLKRTPEQEIILAKMSQKSKVTVVPKKEVMDQLAPKIEQIKERIDQCALQLKAMQDEYARMTSAMKSKRDVQVALLRREIRMAKKELRLRYAHWKMLMAHLEKAQLGPVSL